MDSSEVILGAEYTVRTLALQPDDEGEVIATLLSRKATVPAGRAVLYVHGFVDYFFQGHLADEWIKAGYDFYALDLRKYGRSLLPHQTPNYIESLQSYDEELDEAARIIKDEHGHDVLVVLGHSTGGLVTSLWAHRRRFDGIVDALVLNSPWFDLNKPFFQRTVGTAVVERLANYQPRRQVGVLGQRYGQSLHVTTGGAWDFNLAWKPLEGFPVLAGWLRAIRRGHAELAKGLDIRCPVLVCASTASAAETAPLETISSADIVLDVRHIADRSTRLGRLVTLARIDGGIHDLALSAEPARSRFFQEVFRWAGAYVPESAASNNQ
ncbi:alpha/beta hydrolase [Arthrobacter sp. fls2-241-R2A-172]|uniref:alpha/beta hydrolase n=1 Tax=Arthrobacter sp. fls2-241-R2A-172 TaxID=3040325 RepID=UPI00254C06DB|nr:alpha/beta hydrolase [Arthrobacter sp. fls2-241-R2A-172]